jgi:hypothetical protein
MVAEGWSEAQKRAYVIADNKLTMNGGWDNHLLKGEFATLEGLGFDLDLLGFEPVELAAIRDTRAVGATTTPGHIRTSRSGRSRPRSRNSSTRFWSMAMTLI